MRTERICRVAGALMSQVAWAAFGIELAATEYAGAVADMELCYRAIEPHGSLKAGAVGGVERLVRSHSLLQALSHRVSTSEKCPAANLGHAEWRHPFTGETSTDSFARPASTRPCAAGPRSRSRSPTAATSCARPWPGLNYSGMPVEE